MSTNNVPKKNDLVVRLQTMAAAAKQYFANKTLVIHGETVKTADFVAQLLGYVTSMQSADALHTSWVQAVAQNRETYQSQIAPAISGLKIFAATMLGAKSTEYAAFGFSIKTPQRTLQNKVAAVAQTLATRAARHVMGKKQRQAITGVVPTSASAATATPSSVPAQSASQPSNAPQPASTAVSNSSTNGSSSSRA